MLEAGGTPSLSELKLHNGTVYRWNRPVYDIQGGVPHLRVENRVLAADQAEDWESQLLPVDDEYDEPEVYDLFGQDDEDEDDDVDYADDDNLDDEDEDEDSLAEDNGLPGIDEDDSSDAARG